jgi:hypothetical protein
MDNINDAAKDLKTLVDANTDSAIVGVAGEKLMIYFQRRPVSKGWIPSEFKGFAVENRFIGIVKPCVE